MGLGLGLGLELGLVRARVRVGVRGSTWRSILTEASPRELVAMRVISEDLPGVDGTPRMEPKAPRSADATVWWSTRPLGSGLSQRQCSTWL